jgi:hypothetical protein
LPTARIDALDACTSARAYRVARSAAIGVMLLLGCGDDGGPSAGSACPELSGSWSVSGTCEATSCTVTQVGCTLTLNCNDGVRYMGTATRSRVTFSHAGVSCSAALEGRAALREGTCSASDEDQSSSCDFEAACARGICASGGDGDGDGDDDGGVDPDRTIDTELCAQCLADRCEAQMTTCEGIDECDAVVDCVLDNACWFDDGACVTRQCASELNGATVESANATLHVQSCSLSSCGEACAFSGGGAIGSSPGCSDACGYANDNECDDRGEGSLFDACLFGTDCSDCGSREGETQPSCSEECVFTNDGQCDDGGPGAVTAECRFSTDCIDCGPR